MTKRGHYSGITFKLVACRCGARYATRMESRDGQFLPEQHYAINGDRIRDCLKCGHRVFVGIQQLHPGGKMTNGNPCPCQSLCRSWARVIGSEWQ